MTVRSAILGHIRRWYRPYGFHLEITHYLKGLCCARTGASGLVSVQSVDGWPSTVGAVLPTLANLSPTAESTT